MSDSPMPKWVRCHTIDELYAFYQSIVPGLRFEARRLGYALAVHGSMRRDLDLIAVPWVDKAVDRNKLARALQMVACGMTSAKYTWERKPHGRMATSFAVCWCEWSGSEETRGRGHVDLSVTRRQA